MEVTESGERLAGTSKRQNGLIEISASFDEAEAALVRLKISTNNATAQVGFHLCIIEQYIPAWRLLFFPHVLQSLNRENGTAAALQQLDHLSEMRCMPSEPLP